MAMNMQQIMQQARKMQAQLAEAQEQLKDLEVSASAGGGMVKVTATGDGVITSITIDTPNLCFHFAPVQSRLDLEYVC